MAYCINDFEIAGYQVHARNTADKWNIFQQASEGIPYLERTGQTSTDVTLGFSLYGTSRYANLTTLKETLKNSKRICITYNDVVSSFDGEATTGTLLYISGLTGSHSITGISRIKTYDQGAASDNSVYSRYYSFLLNAPYRYVSSTPPSIIEFYGYDNPNAQSTSTTCNWNSAWDNKWITLAHIIRPYDSNLADRYTCRGYVNGSLVGVSTNTAFSCGATEEGGDFVIGSLGGSDRWYKGSIDYIKIYDTTLSTEQITTIYSDGTIPIDPVGYYKLNKGAGYCPNITNYCGLQFDGTGGSYVNVPETSSLQLTTGVTLSCWIRPDTMMTGYSAYPGFIWKKCTADTSQGVSYCLCIFHTAASNKYRCFRFMISTASGYGWSFTTTKLPISEWVHIAASYDQTSHTAKLYINGSNVLTDSATATGALIASDGNPVRLGIGSGTGEKNSFIGIMRDARIYNRALTATEILTLYERSGQPTSGLVGHWEMDEGEGLTVQDDSGYCNHGTITGSGIHWCLPPKCYIITPPFASNESTRYLYGNTQHVWLAPTDLTIDEDKGPEISLTISGTIDPYQINSCDSLNGWVSSGHMSLIPIKNGRQCLRVAFCNFIEQLAYDPGWSFSLLDANYLTFRFYTLLSADKFDNRWIFLQSSNQDYVAWEFTWSADEWNDIEIDLSSPDVTHGTMDWSNVRLFDFYLVRAENPATSRTNTKTFYFTGTTPATQFMQSAPMMLYNNLQTYAYTTRSSDIQTISGNSCPPLDLGYISKVEIRAYATGKTTFTPTLTLQPIYNGVLGGTSFSATLSTTGADPPDKLSWTSWNNITSVSDMPDLWTFGSFYLLGCKVTKTGTGGAYVALVQGRITYDGEEHVFLFDDFRWH